MFSYGISAVTGNVQCVKLLIKSKAELNLIDLSLGTPLQAACRAIKINFECITLLIQAGNNTCAIFWAFSFTIWASKPHGS